MTSNSYPGPAPGRTKGFLLISACMSVVLIVSLCSVCMYTCLSRFTRDRLLRDRLLACWFAEGAAVEKMGEGRVKDFTAALKDLGSFRTDLRRLRVTGVPEGTGPSPPRFLVLKQGSRTMSTLVTTKSTVYRTTAGTRRARHTLRVSYVLPAVDLYGPPGKVWNVAGPVSCKTNVSKPVTATGLEP